MAGRNARTRMKKLRTFGVIMVIVSTVLRICSSGVAENGVQRLEKRCEFKKVERGVHHSRFNGPLRLRCIRKT